MTHFRWLFQFLKLNSNNHPTVTTLRPGVADGIGTVMQGFESQPTRAASGRLRTVPGGSERLLVGLFMYDQLKHGEHDAFEMLPNGGCLRAYETSCSQAVKHASGWAMRNTNNHNTAILKKSCLGVLVCSRRHTTCPSRPAVHLKPAICHKARAKQIGLQNIVFVWA